MVAAGFASVAVGVASRIGTAGVVDLKQDFDQDVRPDLVDDSS